MTARATVLIVLALQTVTEVSRVRSMVFMALILPRRKVVPHGITLRQVQANGCVFGAQVRNMDLSNILLVHNDEPYCTDNQRSHTWKRDTKQKI